MRDPAGFVGLVLFPPFSSALQSASYYVFDAENHLGIPQDIRRAPGTPFKRITAKISDDSFACKGYGLEQPVPDEDRAKYASVMQADLGATRKLTDVIKINHEIRVREKVLALAATASPGVKWLSDDSNPKVDVDAVKEAIRKAIGVRPNVMTLSRRVMNRLEVHPKLLDLFKFTTPGLMNEQKLASYFGIPRIAVAEQVIATNQEGQAVTADDIWDDDVVLAHVNPGTDLMQLNLGRTFYWDAFGSTGPDGVPIQIETYRDDTVKSDIHRALHQTDEKVVGASAGYVLTDVLE